MVAIALSAKRVVKTGIAWAVVLVAGAAGAQIVVDDGVLSVSPTSATHGDTNITVTFNLQQSTPPVPPSNVTPSAVKIGSIAGTSISRSNWTVTATFTIPIGEPAGLTGVQVIFPVPAPDNEVVCQKLNCFTIIQGSQLTYPIVDTMQATCYNNTTSITCPSGTGNAFYGQDSQYSGTQASFTTSGDGKTVYDNRTGLTWQQSPDVNDDGDIDHEDMLTFDNATGLPDNLNGQHFGGYDDWRLPTIKELYSLIDFRGSDPSSMSGTDTSGLTPFIDRTYFDFEYGDTAVGKRVIDAQYASSTTYVGTTYNDGGAGTMFGVNFADGRIKGYGIMYNNVENSWFVRCVRGNPSYGINNFATNGDGTISDLATGLMWTASDNGTGLNWQNALAYVQTKNTANYLGHNDWRMPNCKELQSLFDYTRSPETTNSPAIDPVFTCTSITNEAGAADYPYYWVNTTHADYDGTAEAANYLCFGRAMGYNGTSWVDVHGAGAQRSEFKSGNPASYPTGHGPQGDAVRIFNYVRLVRDNGYFTITSSAGSNGSISPSGSATMQGGDSKTYTFTPATGYHVSSVLVDSVSAGSPSSYTFSHVLANHTISVSFAIDTFTLTASAGSNGSISSSGATTVNYGTSKTYTITPSSNYHIANVLVDGVSVGTPTSYTFSNVTANHTISATFAINTYTITASTGSNGTVTPSGGTTVNHGASQAYAITPSTGYHVANVLVDSVSVGAVTSYTFSNVTANHTISATFAINTYTMTASAGSNGTIAPSGTATVNYGTTSSYTFTPASCYKVSNVLVDGVSVGAPTSYTFLNVSANHTISVSFEQKTYTVTASAGSGGTVSPAGASTVNCAGAISYTIAPNTGYHIADVSIDGVSIGAVSTGTFTNVTANHVISATFAINTYTIASSAGSGGSISPSGNRSVTHGGSQAYTITPNAGFQIADVLVDGASAGAVSAFTFSNVSAGHTIAASFEPVGSEGEGEGEGATEGEGEGEGSSEGEGEGEGGPAPLAIEVQPAAQTVATGGGVLALSVEVSGGTGVIHYQWYFVPALGAPIPIGADAPALTLLSITEADAGTYYVQVYDDADVLQSSDAIVVLAPAVPALDASTTIALMVLLLAASYFVFRRGRLTQH